MKSLRLVVESKGRQDMDTILSPFEGRCGHRWVGATGGFFGCPLCGDTDGDHHLIAMEPIAVQPEDWGCAWNETRRYCPICGPFRPVVAVAGGGRHTN
jgi:hypothetical protein